MKNGSGARCHLINVNPRCSEGTTACRGVEVGGGAGGGVAVAQSLVSRQEDGGLGGGVKCPTFAA